MDARWWELPGPSGFLRAVWEEVRSGKNIVLALPSTIPSGLREALVNLVRQSDMWTWRDFIATDSASSPQYIVEELHRRFAPPADAGMVLTADSLAADPRLADTLVWVDGLTAARWPAWRNFLGQYDRACRMRPELGRCLFCLPLVGPLATDAPEAGIAFTVRRWSGVVRAIDVQLDLWLLANHENLPPLHRRLAQAVACELSSNDVELARMLAHLELRELLQPFSFLRAEALRRRITLVQARDPRWEDGLLDRIDGVDVVHSIALAARGDDAGLQHRIWKAEVGVLYPFIESQRLQLLPELQPFLRLPVQTTYGNVSDLKDLELGQLRYWLRGRNLPVRVWRLLDMLTAMRHALAHLRPVAIDHIFADELLRSSASQ